AFRIDRFAVLGQHEIVDAPALERDGPLEARRLNADARACVERTLAGRDDRGRARRSRRCSRCGAGLLRLLWLGRPRGRLLLGLGRLLWPEARLPLLLVGRGVEELPREQHRHRQDDGENEVLLVFLVVLHGCPGPWRQPPLRKYPSAAYPLASPRGVRWLR